MEMTARWRDDGQGETRIYWAKTKTLLIPIGLISFIFVMFVDVILMVPILLRSLSLELLCGTDSSRTS